MLVIDHLASYIFPKSGPTISQHYVLGVSLGGHAAWHCLFHDSRINGAIIVIGCPDYIRLMTDRAKLSKRASYVQSNPPGSKFLGSEDFPNELVDAVATWDPAGMLKLDLDKGNTL